MLLTMTDSIQPSAPIQEVSPDESTALGVGFAWELGYTIAVPAVLFGIGGAYLDKYLHTSPLFLLLGFILAFITSIVGVTQKIRYILSKMPKDLPRKPDPVSEEISESEKFHESLRPKS